MAKRIIEVTSDALLDLIVDTNDKDVVDRLIEIHGEVTLDELAWFVEEQELSQDYLAILKEDFERTEMLKK